MTVHVNGSAMDVSTPLTVDHLLLTLNLPRADVAVAVDGGVVPRSQWSATTIEPGADVEVVTAMQGG